MSKQFRWIGVLILLMALAALACDALGGSNNPAANDTANNTANDAAADTPDDSGTSTDAPADDAGTAGEESEQPEIAPTAEGPQTLDMAGLTSGLDTFNSYRASMVFNFEGTNAAGEPEIVHMTMESDRVVEPPAIRTLINIEGTDEADAVGTVEMIVVGGMAYTTVPGLGCFAEEADDDDIDDNPFEDLFDDDFLGEIEGAERVLPDVNIDGVDTYHFVFDEEDVDDDSQIEELDGHIYVAKEGGYVVRLTMDGIGQVELEGEATGDDDDDRTGTIHVEINTTDVNQPVDIQAPADCTSFNLDDLDDLEGTEGLTTGQGAADAPYPVIEQNHDLFVFEEILSYQTETPFNEVIAFYESEMPAAGYTFVNDGSVVTDGSAVLQYTQNDTLYYVTISESDGTVYVQVTPE